MAQIPKFNITALAPQVKDNHNPLDWTISINSTRSLLELTSGLHDIALLMQTCRYVLEHRFHAPVKGRSAGNQAKRSTLSEICDCDTNVLQPTCVLLPPHAASPLVQGQGGRSLAKASCRGPITLVQNQHLYVELSVQYYELT
jgi:hypothetical protein